MKRRRKQIPANRVTPADAAAWFKHHPRSQPISRASVRRYARLMRSRRWVANNQDVTTGASR